MPMTSYIRYGTAYILLQYIIRIWVHTMKSWRVSVLFQQKNKFHDIKYYIPYYVDILYILLSDLKVPIGRLKKSLSQLQTRLMQADPLINSWVDRNRRCTKATHCRGNDGLKMVPLTEILEQPKISISIWDDNKRIFFVSHDKMILLITPLIVPCTNYPQLIFFSERTKSHPRQRLFFYSFTTVAFIALLSKWLHYKLLT